MASMTGKAPFIMESGTVNRFDHMMSEMSKNLGFFRKPKLTHYISWWLGAAKMREKIQHRAMFDRELQLFKATSQNNNSTDRPKWQNSTPSSMRRQFFNCKSVNCVRVLRNRHFSAEDSPTISTCRTRVLWVKCGRSMMKVNCLTEHMRLMNVNEDFKLLKRSHVAFAQSETT